MSLTLIQNFIVQLLNPKLVSKQRQKGGLSKEYKLIIYITNFKRHW